MTEAVGEADAAVLAEIMSMMEELKSLGAERDRLMQAKADAGGDGAASVEPVDEAVGEAAAPAPIAQGRRPW